MTRGGFESTLGQTGSQRQQKLPRGPLDDPGREKKGAPAGAPYLAGPFTIGRTSTRTLPDGPPHFNPRRVGIASPHVDSAVPAVKREERSRGGVETSQDDADEESGGARGDRTPDLDNAIVALSQLSYGPIGSKIVSQEKFTSLRAEIDT